MVASMAGFGLNDAIVKLVSEELPLSQIILIRGLFVNIGALALIYAGGVAHALPRVIERPVVLRGITDIFTTFLFLVGLTQMPIANATAILNAAPMVLTAMSVLLLREVVGGRRWAAIAAGFAGVLLVAQPGAAGFNAYAFLVLAATVSLGFRDILTRFVDPATPSLIVTFSASLLVTLAAGAYVVLAGQWQPVALPHLAYLAGAAALLFVGLHFTIIAMRTGDISVVAPFRYSIILWALLTGYLIWSDIPNLLAFAGIALISASGVYVFHREYATGRGVLTARR
jgi:drug/metabolite transporter (DMT)-like permease